MHQNASNSAHDEPPLNDKRSEEGFGTGEWAWKAMAEWREKGYVPDSDEEEGDLEGSTPATAITAGQPDHEQANADKLEDDRTEAKNDTSLSRQHVISAGSIHDESHAGQAIETSTGTGASESQPLGRLSEKHDQDFVLVGNSRGVSGAEISALPSSDSLGKNGVEASPCISVAEQLQAELALGLKTIDETLRGSNLPAEAMSVDGSGSSSPLSSAQSLPDIFEVKDISAQPSTLDDGADMSPKMLAAVAAHMSPPRRTTRDLRQRNPIQLHPYALEDARYQRELRARGLKPIRVFPVDRIRDERALETQGSDDLPSSPLSISEVMSDIVSRGTAPESQSPMVVDRLGDTEQLNLTTGSDDEDELPDIMSILNSKDGAALAPSSKRRKLEHRVLSEAADQLSSNGFHFYDLPISGSYRNSNADGDINMFDVPPSPPRSGVFRGLSTISSLPKPGRVGKSATPKGLPTPVVSSSTKQTEARSLIELSSQSVEEIDSDNGISSRSPSPPQSPTPTSTSEDETLPEDIELQRRVRGVLPASWLKLDLKARSTAATRPSGAPSSTVTRHDRKGVAQRLYRAVGVSRAGSNRRVELDLLSEDSAPDEDSPRSLPEQNTGTDLDLDGEDDGLPALGGDDVEEDEVEAMTPSISRRSMLISTQNKSLPTAQRGMRGFEGYRSYHYLPGNRQKRKRQSGNLSSRAWKDRHEQEGLPPPVPPLGILDLLVNSEEPDSRHPGFVRIAARKAQLRRDKGRRSPSRKYIQLSTKEDTTEANLQLVNWRQGRFKSPQNGLSFTAEHASRQTLPSHESRISQTLRNSERPTDLNLRELDLLSLKHCTAVTVNTALRRHHTDSGFGFSSAATRSLFTIPPAIFSSGLRLQRPSQHLNRPSLRQLVSSFARLKPPRTAQLETANYKVQSGTPLISLVSRLKGTNKRVVREAVSLDQPQSLSVLADSDQCPDQRPSTREAAKPRRSRKSEPKRFGNKQRQVELVLDADTTEGRLVSMARPSNTETGLCESVSSDLTAFKMEHLTLNTGYHRSTFIGNGNLAKTINVMVNEPRDLFTENGHRNVEDPATSLLLPWSEWNGSTGLQFQAVLRSFQSRVNSILLYPNVDEGDAIRGVTYPNITLHTQFATGTLRDMIGYLNDSLYFTKVEDCPTFTTTAVSTLQGLLRFIKSSVENRPVDDARKLIHVLNYCIVLMFQVCKIASRTGMDETLQQQCWSLFDEFVQNALLLGFTKTGMKKMMDFLKAAPGPGLHVIEHDHAEIDTIVLLNHLSVGKAYGDKLSSVIDQVVFTVRGSRASLIPHKDLSLVLMIISITMPFRELDVYGVPQRGDSNFIEPWDFLVDAYDRFLKFWQQKPQGEAKFLADLGRYLITFSLLLVRQWDCKNCGDMIQALCRAYNNSDTHELFGEVTAKSPAFLERREQHFPIIIDDEDSGFHTYLKLIATTIRHKVANDESESRLASFIFSLVPNSGQVLRKDQAHTLGDMNRLRNVYDLCSVLYIGSSDASRPRILAQIQAVVDLEASHIYACRVMCHTWSRLVFFEIAHGTDIAMLSGLAKWFQEMCFIMMKNHATAEAEVRHELTSHDRAISTHAHVVMRSNQAVIEKFLEEAFNTWHECMGECMSTDKMRRVPATVLLFGENFDRFLAMCQPRGVLRYDIVSGILGSVNDYITHWSQYVDDVILLENLHRPLKRLISDFFGGSGAFNEEILDGLAECWFVLAEKLVKRGVRSGIDYLDPSGADSWHSFPDSSLTRSKMAGFVAFMVRNVEDFYADNQRAVLILWICALLEAESNFISEAKLTSVILHTDLYNPLLLDLPLVSRDNGSPVQVHADDLERLRSHVLATLLQKMRKLTIEPDSQDQMLGLCQTDYEHFLTDMMKTMRKNYMELPADPQKKLSYSTFILDVIDSMETWTTHLHAIDPWFSHGTQLPINLNSVAKRLKEYSSQIVESSIQKRMVVYIQTVTSQAAALPHDQDRLHRELLTAFLPRLNSNDWRDPHLMTLVFRSVFPAFIERSFQSPAFILVRPVQECVKSVYWQLIHGFNLWETEHFNPFIKATHSILAAFAVSMQNLNLQTLLASPSQLRSFSLILHAVTYMVSRWQGFICLRADRSYIDEASEDIWEHFAFFFRQARLFAYRLPDEMTYEINETTEEVEHYFPPPPVGSLRRPALSDADTEILELARHQVRDALSNWYQDGGRWWVQGSARARQQMQGGATWNLNQEIQDAETIAKMYVRQFVTTWGHLLAGRAS